MMPNYYTVYLPEPLTDDIYRQWLALAAPNERDRLLRRRDTFDRHRSLACHTLLRCALSETLQTAPHSIAWAREANGKPYLPGRDDVHFSISHSGAYGAVAVHDKPIGIDIQHMRDVPFAKLASRYFLPDESAQMQNAEEAEQRLLFYRYWTMKESYLKRSGKGMSALGQDTRYADCDFYYKQWDDYMLCLCY